MEKSENQAVPDCASLQKSIRLLQVQVWVIGLALFSLTAYTMIPNKAENGTIRANAFELIDRDNQLRAELSIRNNDPGLFIKDMQGIDRLAALHTEEGSGFYVYDATGTTRLGVAQFAHGGGGFAIHGENSKGATVLYMKDQRGSLRFFDKDGNVSNQVSNQP